MTDGPITINNLLASYNADDGACLDNGTYHVAGTPGLILTGANTFSGNHADGLTYGIWGTVTLYRITADDNGADGLIGASMGNVLITGGSMIHNGQDGWDLSVYMAGGTITLRSVWAYGNGALDENPGAGSVIKYRY